MGPDVGVGTLEPFGVGVVPVHHAGSEQVEGALGIVGNNQPRDTTGHARLGWILADLLELFAIHVRGLLAGWSRIAVAVLGGAPDRDTVEATHPDRRTGLL